MRMSQATCVQRPVHVRSLGLVDTLVGTSPALGLDFACDKKLFSPNVCVVSTQCTQKQGEAGVPGARPVAHRTICAINGYFIYIVRIVPSGLFTPTSGPPGRSVWTGDYTNGWRAERGGAGAAGNPALDSGWAWAARGAAGGRSLPGLASDLPGGRKPVCLR